MHGTKGHQQKSLGAVVVLTLWLDSTMLHTRFIHCQMRQLLSNCSSDLVWIGMLSWHTVRVHLRATKCNMQHSLLIQSQAYASLASTSCLCKN